MGELWNIDLETCVELDKKEERERVCVCVCVFGRGDRK